MLRVEVGQKGGSGGEDRQRADGLAGQYWICRHICQTGYGAGNERQQPEGRDAAGGVRRPCQRPPFFNGFFTAFSFTAFSSAGSPFPLR